MKFTTIICHESESVGFLLLVGRGVLLGQPSTYLFLLLLSLFDFGWFWEFASQEEESGRFLNPQMFHNFFVSHFSKLSSSCCWFVCLLLFLSEMVFSCFF